MNIATQRVKTFKLNRLSSRVMSVYRGDSPLVSGGIKNGDVVTILGTGFGSTSPTVLLWDTVDNQGDVYDALPDGSSVPLRGLGDVDAPYLDGAANRMTLESIGTYGNRNRVYHSTGDSHMGKPNGLDNDQSGVTQLYQRFYLKSSINPFADGYSSDKFFRVSDEIDGGWLRISCSNNEMYADSGPDALPEPRIEDDVTGIGKAGDWFLCEMWVDVSDANELKTRYSNVNTSKLTDPRLVLRNPSATGLIAAMFGFDDGDDTTAGEDFWYSDYYIASSRYRVELCNNPDWKKATIREVQQVVSVLDNKVEFIMDAQRLNPAEAWAAVIDDNDEQIGLLEIGTPVAKTQDIRYPSAVFAGGSTRCAQLATPHTLSSADSEIEFEFLLLDSSCEKVSFTYDTFNNLIEYDLVAQEWKFRIGASGTEFNNVPASRKFDTGEWVKLRIVTQSGQLDVYIDDDVVPEFTGTGTVAAFTANQFGRISTGAVNDIPKCYMRNIKLTDINNTSNSKYWKLDEQLGIRVRDYSQDPKGVDDFSFSFIEYWRYLPNEGY